MQIRVSGSTSATKSLSSSVSVSLSLNESNGVKSYESAPTNLFMPSGNETLNAEVSLNTFGKELGFSGLFWQSFYQYRKVYTKNHTDLNQQKQKLFIFYLYYSNYYFILK